MRLSDVLEKVELNTITQVDNFLEGKSLPSFGVQRKITIGRIAKNYFCKSCIELATENTNSCIS